MNNNPLSESEPNKTPASYGGSKATNSSDIKELDSNTDTKDSSSADSKNYSSSADDQQNNNSSSDKGKSPETTLPSSSETPLSNPVSKQASS
jgi:hypothetical protein